MINFFKKSPILSNKADHQSLTLHLSGLHCSSCAVNIDLALEELPGVITSKTNYAKQVANITYDPNKATLDEIYFTIRDLGYSIK